MLLATSSMLSRYLVMRTLHPASCELNVGASPAPRFPVLQDTIANKCFGALRGFLAPIVYFCKQRIGFMAARKSLRHWAIGPLCRAVGIVPVDRAQDMATPLTGHIAVPAGSLDVRGEGTRFLSEIEAGETFKLKLKPSASATLASATASSGPPSPHKTPAGRGLQAPVAEVHDS